MLRDVLLRVAEELSVLLTDTKTTLILLGLVPTITSLGNARLRRLWYGHCKGYLGVCRDCTAEYALLAVHQDGLTAVRGLLRAAHDLALGATKQFELHHRLVSSGTLAECLLGHYMADDHIARQIRRLEVSDLDADLTGLLDTTSRHNQKVYWFPTVMQNSI